MLYRARQSNRLPAAALVNHTNECPASDGVARVAREFLPCGIRSIQPLLDSIRESAMMRAELRLRRTGCATEDGTFIVYLAFRLGAASAFRGIIDPR